jgi:hypothetical protein
MLLWLFVAEEEEGLLLSEGNWFKVLLRERPEVVLRLKFETVALMFQGLDNIFTTSRSS